MKHTFLLAVIAFTLFSTVTAQNSTVADKTDKEAAYRQAINSRADKIVNALSISDPAKASRVKTIIANQYLALNDIQTQRDARIKDIKSQSLENKEVLNAKIKTFADAASTEVEKLHGSYLQSLSKELTTQQVDKVKDGMTYNVTPITYNGYLAMIPTLSAKQKAQILVWLVEAREHAMDAESSEKKHAWFGKYKGRINNYLSAEGYDLKKEGEEWEKRRKAGEPSAKS